MHMNRRPGCRLFVVVACVFSRRLVIEDGSWSMRMANMLSGNGGAGGGCV